MIIRIFGLVLLVLFAGAVLLISGQIGQTDRTLENVLGTDIAVILETEETRYEVTIPQGSSVFDVMQTAQDQGFTFAGREFSGLGFFVEEIEGKRQNPKERMYWIYYVNGKKAQVGVSLYIIEDNNVITFKYEEME
ncbi:MAG: DUF4430 domain-containing protein [Patescibacteria group bacterium]|nr:DUF4430 domain-containing protein [Patescibacteria group bacterium]